MVLAPVKLTSEAAAPVRQLLFENIDVEFLPEGERVAERPVMMDNFDEMSGRSIYAKNVQNLTLKNVNIRGRVDTQPELISVEHTTLSGVDYQPLNTK